MHVALALLAGSLALAPTPVGEVDFEELGQAFLKTHCPKGATPDSCPLESVVASEFATLRLGAVELAFPLEYLEGGRRMEAQVLARAALDLQAEWVRRFAREPATVETAESQVQVLRAWVDGWSKSELASAAKGDGGNLFERLEADEAVRSAAAAFAPLLTKAEDMHWTPQFTERVQLLVAPTRRDFMELVGYTGLALPNRREELWHEGVTEWTQFWVDKTVVLALEYAPWGDAPDFNVGLSMTKFDKDGLRQHFVQQAAGALLFTSLNRVDMTLFEKGLAVDLTVAVCGDANTIDGEGSISSTGARTAPYERFVPGGNSSGGTLPAIPAAPLDGIMKSRWREDPEHMFAGALRDGQRAGAKRAKKDREHPLSKDERAHFELLAESGKKLTVSAPFLGSAGQAKDYPEADYLNDLRELYRSYQACFLDWLRREGVPGDPAASAAKCNALLAAVSAPERPSIEDAAATIYGEPLTTSDASTGLEWRFLAWLAGE